ncbi:MAG: heme ABC transporter permease CcmC [Candidatus Tectimicrobiota bacterium]
MTPLEKPICGLPRSTVTRLFGLLAAGGLTLGLITALLIAPPDAIQGEVQRIMYLHVPTAWNAYMSFAVVCVCSAAYLFTRNLAWDRRAAASAEIGIVFTVLTIAAGSIWGRPTWGTWWTWDARLTTTAILLFIYIGYLVVRQVVGEPTQRARLAAVIGIIGFLDVPLIRLSVKWWRTLHQTPTVFRSGGMTIDRFMLFTLFLNLLAFGCLYLYLMLKRTELEMVREVLMAEQARRMADE